MGTRKTARKALELGKGEVTVKSGGRKFTVPVRNGELLLPKELTSSTILKTPQRTRNAQRRTPARVDLKREGASQYDAASTARRLIGVLGNNTAADLLGVARDRPGRWAKGDGSPDAANRTALADLEALVARLLAAFTPEQASMWLVGDNAHLGARPLDAYRIHGSAPVVEAIRAHEQGAFA
jgi:hypothetical protein